MSTICPEGSDNIQKEALGGNVHVTAPKHYHLIYYNSNYGVWEAMEYEFKINQPEAFTNRATALSAFQSNANIRRIDGSAIPAADWDNWIPNRINRNDLREISVNLGQKIGRRSTIPALYEFIFRTNVETHSAKYDKKDDVPVRREASNNRCFFDQEDPDDPDKKKHFRDMIIAETLRNKVNRILSDISE